MNTGTFSMICRTPYYGALVLDATYDDEAEMWRVEARSGSDAPMATFHNHPVSGMTIAYEEWLKAQRAEAGYAAARHAMEPNPILNDLTFKAVDQPLPGTPPRPQMYEAHPQPTKAVDAKRVVTFSKTWIRNNPDLFQLGCDDFYAKALVDGMATRQMDDGADYHLIAWDITQSNGELEL